MIHKRRTAILALYVERNLPERCGNASSATTRCFALSGGDDAVGRGFRPVTRNTTPNTPTPVTRNIQNPDLTTETRISERGTITFPLVGEISLAGLAPVDAEARIAEKLIKGKFVLKPQVSLNVIRVRSRQVSVLGQVARPGRYPLDDTSSNLTDILALAGGVSPTGDDNVTVMVTRNGKTAKLEINVPSMYRTGDLSRNLQLENGDTIFVQRAPVFYIYGEVQRAGSYRVEQAMTVMQALSLGGGVTPRGTDRGLKIRRKTADGTFRAIDASLTDPVQPDDVIYVRESLF